MKRFFPCILCLAFLALCFATCSSGDDGPTELELCQAKLAETYPSAQNVEWEVYDEFNVAHFYNTVVKAEMEVWFRAGGIIIMKKTDYGTNVSVVPSVVQTRLIRIPDNAADLLPEYLEGRKHITLLDAILYERYNTNEYRSFWHVRYRDGNGHEGRQGVSVESEVLGRAAGDERITPWGRCWNLGMQNVHP